MEQEFLTRDEIVEIVVTHKRKLLNNLRLHIFNSADLDDAFQDCLLSLLKRSILKENAISFISSCFYYWGIDCARKVHRKSSTMQLIGIENVNLGNIYEEEELPSILDETNMSLEDFLNDAINNAKLSDMQRCILNMHYFENKKFKDIAQLLNIRDDSCRFASFKALKKIRNYIETRKTDHYLFTEVTDEILNKCNPSERVFVETLKEHNKLTYSNRKILDLFVFRKKTTEQIATITGIDESFIKSLIRRINKNNPLKNSYRRLDILLSPDVKLTHKHQLIVELTNKGLPPRDIAKKIGKTPKYVMSALYYIRKNNKTNENE